MIEQTVLDTLRATFELYGFAPVETRAVEPLDQLLRKGETSKEVYVLRRLQEDPDAPDDASLGLHFDLTVPFARYVLENAGKLQFPFRRYQIQKAWRGERPQEGRFREFTQADIDVVGRDELPFHHDVEIARVIDKLDKVPADVIAKMLADDAGLSDAQVAQCLALAEIRTPDASFAERVRALGVRDELLDVGLAELEAVIAGCLAAVSERLTVEADLRIARGLDYYTGTVFETRMSGFEGIGSICSGGRYDSLASDGRVTYPGVGISLGISRMLVPLLARGRLSASRSVPSAVLVALPSEADRVRCDEIAQELRRRGIPTEVASSAAKYGRQIRYAERRGIPFVWFPDAGEVRDIRTGDQVPADPGTWTPPAGDLRPQIEENL